MAADQLSKACIVANLAVGESLLETKLLQIVHVRNSGAIFGLFPGHTFALIIASSVFIAVLLFYVFFMARHFPSFNNMLSKTALGLILGGAIGNLIDRVRLGQVTDFIDFRVWPAFNVADSAVTVGAIIFAITLISLARAEAKAEG